MAKFLSVFLISLLCQIFLFETATLRASTFKLGSVSVIGNNRLSDEAIINYSRLSRNTVISSEDLNIAYNKILDTGLFKSAAFKKDGRDLIITVEEYPTINEISFEGNKKFTDEKLESFLVTQSNFVFSPETLKKDLNALQTVYKNSGRYSAKVQPKIINLSNNRVNLIFEIYEGNVLEIEKINFVIQINGKKRALITTNRDISENDLIKLVNNNVEIKKYIKNQEFKKKIFVPNKLINIII